MEDNTNIAFIVMGIMAGSFLATLILAICKKKRSLIFASTGMGTLLVGFVLFCAFSIDTIVSVELVGEPVAVYMTDSQKGGYRYGASILKDEQGNIETFFSSSYENSSIWDVVSYRKATDCGLTWGEEVSSLIPIQNSDEHYSNCDPGAFKVGEYYYVGYTSTFDARGTYNHIYCARSKTPSEPESWEKWNGSGWGGKDPKPIMEYYGTQTEYGIGEPSFIVIENTIYMYYTYIGTLGNGAYVRQTRVATAPKTENWCGELVDIGVARNNRGYLEDSMDVKYIPQIKKFLAVTTDNRFTENSFIRMFMGNDGVAFYEIECDSEKAVKGLHNIGISGDYNGYLALDDSNFVVYSHGIDSWGKWDTSLSYLTFKSKKVVNFKKLFYQGAENPKGVDKKAWGTTNVKNQDEEIPRGTYSAKNVLKDNKDYFWSENYAQARYSTTLTIQAKPGKISGVKFRPTETLEGVPVDFHFEYSQDGVIWKEIEGSEVRNFSATYQTYQFAFPKSRKMKYVRLVADTLGKLGEIDLYALQVEYFSTY